MHAAIPSPACSKKVPWNKGRLIGQKRPLRPKDVWAIRVRLQLKGLKRDLALFNLAIDSKLRACDLVRLRVEDVCAGGRVRDRGTVIQKKTGRPVQFEITEQTRASIRDWISDGSNGGYLFPSRFRQKPHLSTRQYARIVHAWVESIGLDNSAYGTTRCAGRRRHRSTRRPETCEPFSCSWDIRNLKAPCAISGSRSTMHSASRSRSSCRSKEAARPWGSPGPRPSSEDRYLLKKRSPSPSHRVDPFCP
jgi:integrase-like protein